MPYIGNQPFGKTVRNITSETLTTVKTLYYPTGGYTVGYVDVYLNGVRLTETADFTATDGSLVTLLFNPLIGDTVDIVSYGSVELANAVRRSGDTLVGTLNTQALVPTANVTYDIGTSTMRYRDIYLSGNTINLGDVTLTANATSFRVANTTGGTFPSSLANTTITGTLTVSSNATFSNTVAVTGNVTFSNTVAITGATTFSNTVAIGSDFISQHTGMRNRIINGDMRIDQRNAGASVSLSGSISPYVLDRWRFWSNGSSGTAAFTVQQSSTAPSGFVNSVLITQTASFSPTGSQYNIFAQYIEGYNTADLNWGTANAKTVTLSFWVRSSLTGTFGGVISNSAQDRSYPFTYTISSANTWEFKTITVAGDTSGTWLTTNGIGLEVYWQLGVGSSYLGTAGAWAGATYLGATGATQITATNGATFYITGVQLEVGSVATPFERRPYGTELQLCQRYYQKVFPQASNVQFAAGFNTLTTSSRHVLNFLVEMRIAPTALETSGTAGDYVVNTKDGNIACSAVPSFAGASKSSLYFVNTTAGSLVAGEGSAGRTNSTTAGLNAYLAWSAEL